ncbi:MAG: Holliday junction branch migration DNA helicase RuvB [bacterium]|nr:Holliday junction branch migration DNA helicase RuvB [bacterium]
MREDGLLVAQATGEEQVSEVMLRPRSLEEFVGQPKIKERLAISMEASETLGRPMDHLLLSGPPGLGKTTLARIIAYETGAQLRSTSGPAVERPGDLAAILSGLEHGDVLFIDEIHRLPRVVEEVLYSAMEDFALDIVVGKGPTAQSLRLGLPRFTLVGATTRIGTVTAPLRDRFGMVDRLDYYDADDLERIVVRSASIIGVPVTAGGARRIATRSRGTPRIANRLLARVSEYAIARADGRVDSRIAMEGLAIWEVDDLGLDKVDRFILDAIVSKFGGGPVGLTTLAIAVGEEPETIEAAYEPFLVQQGLVSRTPRGRVATSRTYQHLGVPEPGSAQGTLLGQGS